MDKTDFLNQILQDPASDEPRLIYADWLSEHGDPRGEFIHVQCALAQAEQAGLAGSEQRRLKQRERELYREQIAILMTELPRGARDPEFVRGFIGHATMGIQTFIESGRRICEQIPLQSVTLTGGAKQMKKLVDCPWLEQIESIRFQRNRFASNSMAIFASCLYLGNLKSLEVTVSSFSSEDILALSQPFSMNQLRSLSLRQTYIDDQDLCMLAESESYQHLENLSVEFSPLQGEFVHNAVFNESLKRLEITDDGGIGMSGNSILQNLLTTHRVFPNLEALILNRTSVSNHTFIEFVQSNPFPKLHTLGLNHCQINDEGVFILASSPLLAQLKDVRMSHNDLQIDGLTALARSPHRRKGARFYLPQYGISARDIREFRQEFGNFGQLR